MAPPTPVLVREDINRVYEIDKKTKGLDCALKSITQFECSFDGGLVSCVPFKRLFKECILQNGEIQRVEITDIWTNNDHKDAAELYSFLHAKEKIRKLYERDQNQPEE